jgi:multidrug resistance efflux pump
MRFRRSVLRPDGRGAVSVGRSPRRLWRFLRPRAALLAIAAAAIAGVAADRAWIRGNGIVAGELTAVAPIVQARLQRLFVHCLDQVVRGQRLAEFDNEAAVEAAAQQLQQLQLELTQARAQIEVAEQEAEAARKLVDAQLALYNQLVAVLKAEDELLKSQYVATLVWEKAKADVARADAEVHAAEYAYQTKRADQKMAELDAEVLQKRIDSFIDSPELTGHFYLTAPKDGIVTECTTRPGEVIAAKAPIFQLFNPEDVFAVVFFDPADIGKLAPGQTFAVNIGGIDETVTGHVAGFYPELAALPASLTRYFWQQEKWSQYAPVRLDFDDLSTAQRSRLLAWAQLSASRWQGWRLPANALAWLSSPWQWVQHRLGSAWHFAASSFAHQPMDE